MSLGVRMLSPFRGNRLKYQEALRYIHRGLSSEAAPSPPRLLNTLEEMRKLRRSFTSDLSIGFVPTMGALHIGHIKLMERARRENDIVVISVFVNPAQFGPNEDFNKYPRRLQADVEQAKDAGVDYVFCPTVNDMYPSSHRCYVVPEGFDKLSEGIARPGHFRGVATVVTKLFGLVQPTRAYFGQKDAMQCVVMRRMVEDLNLSPEVIICPTIRESDGLAMSSRNAYLDGKERKAAPVVYASLRGAQEAYKRAIAMTDSIDANLLREVAMTILQQEPLVHKVEYVSIGRKDTMEELDRVDRNGAIISVALRLGNVRLIDNLFL